MLCMCVCVCVSFLSLSSLIFLLCTVVLYASELFMYRPYSCDVTFEILFSGNAAILSGKKIARFYTISETQAARNLCFQYVNYQ